MTVKGNTATSRALMTGTPVSFEMPVDHEIGSNLDSDSQDIDGVVEEMIDLDTLEAFAITGERIVIS